MAARAGPFRSDIGAERLFQRMSDTAHPTSLVSDFTKAQKADPSFEERCKMSLIALQKAPATKPKTSSRTTTFGDQIKRLEERQKGDLAILDDMQEFVKQRAKLDSEYAANLQKLTQQFQTKRKWPDMSYEDGHANILTVDLWKLVLKTTNSEAQSRTVAAEKLQSLVGETFEARKEEKKMIFRTALKVLNSLQDELCKIDHDVCQAKKQYDHAMKELKNGQKRTVRKRHAVDTKKLESKVQTARHAYLLELAAANSHYLHFRNSQLPEVMETVNSPGIDFLKNMMAEYSRIVSNETAVVDMTKKLSSTAQLLSPEFEWRRFMHDNKSEFPGRQLFDMEPYSPHEVESRDMVLDDDSKLVLSKLRKLLQHSCDTMHKELMAKEEQLESLQSLHAHYTKAGDVFDKTQSNTMHEKMVHIHSEIEGIALQRSLLEAKIQKISDTGLDSVLDTATTTPHRSAVMDVGEAQAMEEARRRTFLETGVDVTANKALEEAFRKSYNGSATTPTNGQSPAPSETSSDISTRRQSAAGNHDDMVRAARLSAQTAMDDFAMETQSTGPDGFPFERNASQMSVASTANTGSSDDSPLARALRNASTRLNRGKGSLRDGVGAGANAGGSSPAPPPPPPPLPSMAEDEDEGPPPPPLPPPPVLDDEEFTDMELPPAPTMQPAMNVFNGQRSSGSGASAGFGRASTTTTTRSGLFSHGRNLSTASGLSATSDFDDLEQAEVPLQYKALYAYPKAQDDDLELNQDEHVYVLVVRDDGWCLGLNSKGNIGYFPQSYVSPAEANDPSLPSPQVVDLPPSPHGFGFGMAGASPVRIDHVTPNSPAHAAGLSKGDLILEVASRPVADLDMAGVSQLLLQSGGKSGCRLCVINMGN